MTTKEKLTSTNKKDYIGAKIFDSGIKITDNEFLGVPVLMHNEFVKLRDNQI